MRTDSTMFRKLVHGAVDIKEENGRFKFSRFTPAERKVYQGNIRAFATSGVRLEFRTDACSFTLSGSASAGSSRHFYYFDVAINGVLCHHVGSESWQEQPEFRFEIPLDGGLNEVCVYFPCLARIELDPLDFSGESVLEPMPRKRTMICYGDSITQGYDARYPSLSYPNQLADGLQAEMFNKAIGGDHFNPPLAANGGTIRPDLITTAYGTNDWSHKTREEILENGAAFFRNLNKAYPGVPIIAVLPIWRTQCETRITKAGRFSEMYEMIRAMTASYPRIRLVNGLSLVPHLAACFSPDILHPNDFGFQFMGRNLLREIRSVLAPD